MKESKFNLDAFREENIDKLKNILQDNQIDVLNKIQKNLKLHYQTAQVFRTEVEMRFSVLNDGKYPTADAKYYQAVREQIVHFTNLVFLNYEYNADQIKLKNIKDMIKKHGLGIRRIRRDIERYKELKWDDLDVEEAGIKIDMLQNKIDTLKVEIEKLIFIQMEREKTADNRWREVVTWEKLCMELIPRMKYSILSCEHHQPGSYARRMERQYQTMLKSGAKGSPSEAINITNQNDMIKKLMKNGTLDPVPELPIDKAVKEVLANIENDNNYIDDEKMYLPIRDLAEVGKLRTPSQIEVPVKSKFINDKLDTILGNPSNTVVEKKIIKSETDILEDEDPTLRVVDKDEIVINPQVPKVS